MPNVPRQYPGIDLPGAEYFNLAPDRQIALQGRRRVSIASTITTIAASTTTNISPGLQTLETGFTDNSGIYIHWFETLYNPQLPLAPANSMPITGMRAFLQLGGNTLDIGQPQIVNPQPTIGVVVLSERDRLITARDILFGFANNQLLQLNIIVSVSNTNAGTFQASVQFQIVYSRLDGIVE